MDSATVGKSLPIQSSQVVCRSNRCIADVPPRLELSGSSLEGVVYEDVSTSIDSSSRDSFSHIQERGINPGAKAGDELLDACKAKATSEQACLLKHGVWSVGSPGHVDGLCKPCHYVHSSKGCMSGSNCTFCHLPHVPCSSPNGNRPSRERRAKCKQLLDSLCESHGGHLDGAADLHKQVASQSLYVQMLMANKNQPEQRQGSAVNKAQDPVDCPVTAKVRRGQLARNAVKAVASSAAAAAAAKDGPACLGDAEKRCRSNFVSVGQS
mmetsp:Transcript_66416/g.128516  ORF Transcript_66416/g.128516 Transcript_66416/m.128516 type:complete len:267 (-) Transcript_66416:283-1083(-)